MPYFSSKCSHLLRSNWLDVLDAVVAIIRLPLCARLTTLGAPSVGMWKAEAAEAATDHHLHSLRRWNGVRS